MRLEGKVCIITGAGGGMGRTAAQMFAQHGAKVAVFELNQEAGEETVTEIQKEGGEATFFTAM